MQFKIMPPEAIRVYGLSKSISPVIVVLNTHDVTSWSSAAALSNVPYGSSIVNVGKGPVVQDYSYRGEKKWRQILGDRTPGKEEKVLYSRILTLVISL